MVDKYRGILPPNSTWYKFNRLESIAFLKAQGLYDTLTPEQREGLGDLDLQAQPGKTEAIEQLIANAGLKVITLFD